MSAKQGIFGIPVRQALGYAKRAVKALEDMALSLREILRLLREQRESKPR